MSLPDLFYFDNNATTRVAPEVVEAMLPYLVEYWGNPSSAYQFGYQIAKQIENARGKVASLINADPREIVFTSCGTESNNAALHSALTLDPSKRHLVTTVVEHSANLRFAQHLARTGYDVTFLPVRADGTLEASDVASALRPDTALVSVMWANNETGVLFPLAEIAEVCRARGVPLHSDAVQAAGKVKLDVKAVGVDFLSLSAHKLYAPKGVGMLYVRRQARFQPFVIGGNQERNRRGGTENVASIIGFGRAAELAVNNLGEESTRVRDLRDRLEGGILATISGTAVNGARECRLPNTSNIAFESVEAEALLIKLDQLGICASSGSACASGSLEPSHVLRAMGMSPARARSSIRLSLGLYTTLAEVEYVVRNLAQAVAQLRALSGPPPAGGAL